MSTDAGHTAFTRTPAVGELERHRLRQQDHAALRRAVRRVVRRGLDAGDRRHVDDRPGGLEQRRQRGLREQERAGEVDVDDAAPLVGRHVLDPVAGRDPGDVGEHVEPAVPLAGSRRPRPGTRPASRTSHTTPPSIGVDVARHDRRRPPRRAARRPRRRSRWRRRRPAPPCPSNRVIGARTAGGG